MLMELLQVFICKFHLRQTFGYLDMVQPLFEVLPLLLSDFHEQ